MRAGRLFATAASEWTAGASNAQPHKAPCEVV
jgi:hypothetical protein